MNAPLITIRVPGGAVRDVIYGDGGGFYLEFEGRRTLFAQVVIFFGKMLNAKNPAT